jgi:hypothetical protein
LETAGYRSISVKDANENIVKAIISSAELFLEEQYRPKLSQEISYYSMKDFLAEWCIQLPKPLILLVDEIDKVDIAIDTFFLGPIQDARIWLESRPPIDALIENIIVIFTKIVIIYLIIVLLLFFNII